MTAGAPTRTLQVTPLTGTIGAELSGVDLSADVRDDVVAETRAALLQHRVVFFRGQDLEYEQQVAFAQRFGPLTLGHPTIKSPDDKPLMEEVDSATHAPAADWHTDVTFLDQPVSFTFLHGKVMPDVGGDTVWANTVNAYKYYLSDELRAIARTRASTRATETPRGTRPVSSSSRRSTDRSTRWSPCTRRPASARCCSAGSRTGSSVCLRTSRAR
jgi:taurine dioxygenase